MAEISRRPYKVLDRTRSVKKGVMASSLEEFITSAQRKLCYSPDTAVVVVLEEDGTEVDEDDYFQTLDPNTCLMLLHAGDRWSPFSAVALGMSYLGQSYLHTIFLNIPHICLSTTNGHFHISESAKISRTFLFFSIILSLLKGIHQAYRSFQLLKDKSMTSITSRRGRRCD